jgi:hypothetical protein
MDKIKELSAQRSSLLRQLDKVNAELYQARCDLLNLKPKQIITVNSVEYLIIKVEFFSIDGIEPFYFEVNKRNKSGVWSQRIEHLYARDLRKLGLLQQTGKECNG